MQNFQTAPQITLGDKTLYYKDGQWSHGRKEKNQSSTKILEELINEKCQLKLRLDLVFDQIALRNLEIKNLRNLIDSNEQMEDDYSEDDFSIPDSDLEEKVHNPLRIGKQKS
ncbi:uncharacterized protein MONOS_18003 [Monocercomonoides exilis]|uniref:uncharacterized protein n=1 Tax=Monocercomonoides exilis TaxID=2049356 RepID=UPI0035593FB4|nr:hypothetical protein MONOS_18003 [Monocercomonoides exilis]